MKTPFNCKSYRRFGVELEVNPLNGVVKRPDTDCGEIPVGSDYITRLIKEVTGERVTLQGWDHIHNNTSWVVKPDNSCGIEINTPILKGWADLEKLLNVIDKLESSGINSNNLCSLHVHVNIADLNEEQLASVIAYYVKCEHIFFDSVPSHRKNSRYCPLLGTIPALSHDFDMSPINIINAVSGSKYYSMNCYHFCKGGGYQSYNSRKQTIEFRIMEGSACLDSFVAKNWIRFLLHFVEVTSKLPLPKNYVEGDKQSSLLWLDPSDLFEILHFNEESISDGLKQVRDWFTNRLLSNGYDTGVGGIWSNKGRRESRKDLLNITKTEHQIYMDKNSVYEEKYII